MKHDWISFKELRKSLDFGEVLQHYGVAIQRKGDQHQGPCPLPGHDPKKRASSSFSANLDRGIFQCFGCGAKGNLLDFAGLMEGVNPENAMALRKVAIKLRDAFRPRGAKPEQEPVRRASPSAKPEQRVEVNAPLDFDLKGLDPLHPYLLGRGFSAETLRHFGVGYCERGLLKGRVAIPLHNPKGELVGYAGRLVDDGKASEENPKFVFPEPRERNGVKLEFDRSLLLYNHHRIAAPCDDLIVVQGLPSVWWLHQHGLRHTVATMGSKCSDAQADLIVSLVKPSGRVWIAPDGNAAGDHLAELLLAAVSLYRFVRWVRFSDGEQPAMLSGEDLEVRFSV